MNLKFQAPNDCHSTELVNDDSISVNPRISMLLQIVAWGFVAFTLGKHGIYRPLTIHGVDYPKHWLAARAVLEGKSVYEGPELWLGFNYPQWSALVTFWLGWFDIETAQNVWKMMHLLFVVGCWGLAARGFRPAVLTANGALPKREKELEPLQRFIAEGIERHWLLIAAFLVAAFNPLVSGSLFLGQIEPLNALLVMAFLAALLSGRERLAGATWAMMCLTKMMPVILIVPFLLWRKWRVLQGWIGFMAAYFLALVVTGRVGYEWFFVTVAMEKISFHWQYISISPARLLMLLFAPESWLEDQATYDRCVGVWILTAGSLYVTLTWQLRRRGVELLRAIEVGLVFVPILSPLLESHHFAWMIPLMFLHLARWSRGEMSNTMALILALGWWIINMEQFVYNFARVFTTKWHQFPPLAGALILTAATIFDSLRKRAPGSPAVERTT